MTATATPSQEVQAKAARYLLQGRVRVDYADQKSLSALVTGSRLTAYVIMCIDGRWRCDCPAKSKCAHITACEAIWQPTETLKPQSWGESDDPFSLVGP
jgi:uncharacterized Zn finger protein